MKHIKLIKVLIFLLNLIVIAFCDPFFISKGSNFAKMSTLEASAQILVSTSQSLLQHC